MADCKCTFSSELMKNHKAAKLIPEQASFRTLINSSGHVMIFCISNDGDLNLIIETPESKTGWTSTNLSHLLTYDRKIIRAQHFTIKHYQDSKEILVLLIFSVEGGPEGLIAGLYLSDGDDPLAPSASDQEKPEWWVIPSPPATTILAGKYGLCIQSHADAYVLPYFKMHSGLSAWKKVSLHDGVSAESILHLEIGYDTNIAEIHRITVYQLAKVKDQCVLYRGGYSPFDQHLLPSKILHQPSEVTTFNVLEDTDICFVASQDKLIPYKGDSSTDPIIQHPLISGLKQLLSHKSDKTVSLWGLNQQGVLFYMKANYDDEWLSPKSWSYPIPLLTGIKEMSTCIAPLTNTATVLAHTNDRQIFRLTQDPVTTHWHYRSIALPSPDAEYVTEFYSHTTHVQLLKSNNLPASNKTVSITSTSPCDVYINDVYQKLSPDTPVKNIQTGPSGTVTIVQETDGLGAVCYHLQPEGMEETFDINPMKKIVDTISTVKSGKDLTKITIKDEEGGSSNLVPSGVSQSDKENVAKVLQTFAEIAGKMPADGSTMQDHTMSSAEAGPGEPAAITCTGLSFENGSSSYLEDEGSWLLGAIEASAGDIWRWVKHAYDEVSKFFVKMEKGVVWFFVQIAEKAFKFIMKCIGDVVHAVESVFDKIKVTFEKLVHWLGFLFEWKDIISTHKVLHHIIRQYLGHAVKQIDVWKGDVSDLFSKAKKQIDKAAGLKSIKGRFDSISQSHQRPKGIDSPQANWGIHHLRHNASSATTSAKHTPSTSSSLDGLLKKLEADLKNEKDDFKQAYTVLKDQVIDKFETLSVGEIIERTLGVLAGFITDTMENILLAFLHVLEVLVKDAVAVLDAKITIPIISWVYKKLTGSDLTILDAICLVVAIPATVVYKAVYKKAPFPAGDPSHQQLLQANSWPELQKVHQSIGSSVWQPIWVTVSHLVSFAGSMLLCEFTSLKNESPRSGPISLLHCGCFFAATVPTIAVLLFASDSSWWIRGPLAIVYGITAIEKLIEAASFEFQLPDKFYLLDGGLGIAGFLLNILQLICSKDARGVVTALDGFAWNANRILSIGLFFAEVTADVSAFGGILGWKIGCIATFGFGQLILAFPF